MEEFGCAQCLRPLAVSLPANDDEVRQLAIVFGQMGTNEREYHSILECFAKEARKRSTVKPATIEIESAMSPTMGSYVKFVVNGSTVLHKDGGFGSGLNFVSVDADTYGLLDTRSFNVFQSRTALSELGEWLQNLDDDTIVLAALCSPPLPTDQPFSPATTNSGTNQNANPNNSGIGGVGVDSGLEFGIDAGGEAGVFFDIESCFQMLSLIGGSGVAVPLGTALVLAGVRGAEIGTAQEVVGTANAPVILKTDSSKLWSVAASKCVRRCVGLAHSHARVPMPLCASCFSTTDSDLTRLASDIQRQIELYTDMQSQLQIMDVQQLTSPANPNLAPEKLRSELQRKEEVLEKLRQKSEGLKQQRFEISEMARELDMLEKQYWADLNDLELTESRIQVERDAVLQDIEICTSHLEELRQTNVLNDAFHIWVDGHIATINGFRLGTLPSLKEHFKVEWDEINAALGQLVLLLISISEFLGYDFRAYHLRARGSFSRITRLSDKTEAVLFGPPGFFSKMLGSDSQLNTGLVWLAACVLELAKCVQSRDPTFILHYPIESDLIGGGFSVKFGNEEQWTRAMKYLLTDVKLILLSAVKIGSR